MSVFERLAERLNELPQGFPPTENGVELKILRKIFTPEAAEMALKLKAVPETAAEIAGREGKPVEEIRNILDDMARKGQIGSFTFRGQQRYRLFPFVVGIYEFQRGDRMDKELAEMFEEYAPALGRTAGGHRPHLARVIPVNTAIQADLQVKSHEDVRRIIEGAKSLKVQECICRKEKALLGNPCKHSRGYCLAFSNEADAYDYFKLDGDVISREEALDIVRKAEEEGLVHITYNVENAVMGFICNCCSCSCGLLRGIKDFHAPYLVAKSDFVARIDPDTCAACGDCSNENRCPMDAIEEGENAYRVLSERCIGCGVCAVVCPTQSISLVRRADSEMDPIVRDMPEWERMRSGFRKA